MWNAVGVRRTQKEKTHQNNTANADGTTCLLSTWSWVRVPPLPLNRTPGSVAQLVEHESFHQPLSLRFFAAGIVTNAGGRISPEGTTRSERSLWRKPQVWREQPTQSCGAATEGKQEPNKYRPIPSVAAPQLVLNREPKSVGLSSDATFASRRPSGTCLLYTSPSPRDKRQSRMPSSA